MKDIWKNGVVILLIITVLYVIFLRECKRPEPCPAEDEIIVKKDVWKDIIALANKPAKHDTIWIKGDVTYVPTTPDNPLPQPKPELQDSTNIYADSLINKEINVHYNFKVKGTLEWREWNYKPTFLKITDSIPHPVYVKGDPYEVKVSKNGLYIYGLAGGNGDNFLFGSGLDLITKKETMIGYQFQKFGSDNLHFVKIGVRLGGKK